MKGTAAPDDPPAPDAALPGEAGIPNLAGPPQRHWSRKGLLALVTLLAGLVVVAGVSVKRFAGSGATPEDASPHRSSDRPAMASTEPKRLEMHTPAASASRGRSPRIPALVPGDEETAEPIGVHRTGTSQSAGSNKRAVRPEDAPAMLVTSRSRPVRSDAPEAVPGTEDPADAGPLNATARNLQAYQAQLEGLLAQLGKSSALATPPPSAPADPASKGALLGGGGSLAASHLGVSPTGGGLFGGQLQGSATPKVAASMLGNRSLTLPKGTAFTCALKTKVISATSGLVGCQVQRNVFSDDGRVLLIERGSHLDGEYRIASVRPGTVRIPVLWTRIRTPLGVTVDIDSPGTGQLGESGIDGYVDNRWGERVGAAMLLSLIDDSVKLVIQNQASDRQADTIVLPSTTANTSKLAEKVLESTVNIPPLIYQNQGGIVGIYVARDVDFSSVYELKAVAR
jgi:type IV secretion system protein VirB10